MVNSVGVIGCGVIGASWTTLFLWQDINVVATDPAPGAEARLREMIKKSWESLESLHAPKKIPFELLKFVPDIVPFLSEVDFVQENGPENVAYKSQIFDLLSLHTRPPTILASSSSGLPSSQFITSNTVSPSRILIGHPFNPPHLIPTIEIVPNSHTSEEAIETAKAFYLSLGKKPVVLRNELPGFVANRLQAALVQEAYSLVSRGIVSAADIDSIVSNSLALRWANQGPFLTKVLGGGGNGIAGFENHLASLGKAAAVWSEDMRAHAFQPTEENHTKLIDSVRAELAERGEEDLEGDRDRFLVEVLKIKGN